MSASVHVNLTMEDLADALCMQMPAETIVAAIRSHVSLEAFTYALALAAAEAKGFDMAGGVSIKSLAISSDILRLELHPLDPPFGPSALCP